MRGQYDMEKNKIYHGNNLDILRTFEDNSIDSIVTDPPYGISFMNKKWDYDVPSVEFWKEALRVLKPGGHALVACGTRTQHRMAVNLEDAGFEIRDIVAWVYGSGFPKSHDISKAIDKRGGNNIGWFGTWLREWREKNNIKQSDISKLFPSKTGGLTGCVANWELGLNIPTAEQYSKIVEHFNLPFKTIEEAEREVIGKYNTDMGGLGGERLGNKGGDITAPATDQAKQWQGWGTALKPAMELWTLCRKPLQGTVAQNVLKYGVGGINIDGCRVGTTGARNNGNSNGTVGSNSIGVFRRAIKQDYNMGRFPANFIHDGSEEVVKLFPNDNGSSASGYNFTPSSNDNNVNIINNIKSGVHFGDSGSAARFYYTAKASQTERNWGLGEFDESVTTDGRIKSIDNAFNRGETKRKNIHPTVKPIDLMRYLVRLITPKGGICLDPFMGSGTTAVACKMESFNFIGCELDEEYVKIAEARINAVKDYDTNIDTKEAIQESQKEQKEKEIGIMNIFDFMGDGDMGEK